MSSRSVVPVSLPSGTVTFLFTDIERSTELTVELGGEYPGLLGRYRELTVAAAAAHGGVLFGSEGDGLFLAFAEARAAAAAAEEAQLAYRDEPWPGGGPVRVRIGIHTGTPTLIGDDYTGIDVHRAARITSAAWGGQVIVSETTRALLGGTDTTSRELGWYALKGLSRPERLYQLDTAADDLFPPPRARPRGVDLPIQLTSLVGRAEEVATVSALLLDGARLVTLTGPGGIGKTRIAIAVAERLDPQFADGVAFVDLSAEEEPARVAAAIAGSIGVISDPNRSASDALADHLAPLELLLVLDGFERVAAAGTQVADLLGRCPRLRALVTSRAALMVGAEREHRVQPLAVAAPGLPPEQIAAAPAVRLFVDRVQAVRPGFEVTAGNAATVASLVSALDGLPLSLELAAARTRLLPPEAILSRLGAVLDLSTSAADLPERQRSLRATIEWSHGMLAEEEQVLLRRLGVFSGGWTVEAAEALCPDPAVGDVLASLETLASQSLITADSDGRMDMGTALREFTRERLDAAGEAESTRRCHAEYFAALAAATEPPMRGRRQRELVATVSKEWPNLRSAAEWALRNGRYDLAGSMFVDTWIVAWHGDHWLEAADYTDRFVATADTLDEALRARVMFIAGGTYMELGDGERGQRYGRLAVDLASRLGDVSTEAWGRLIVSGSVMFEDVFAEEARRQIEQAVSLARSIDEPFTLGYALSFLGTVRTIDGDVASGLAAHRECLETARSIDNVHLLTQAFSQTAIAHLVAGDPVAARRCLQEGVEFLDDLRSVESLAIYLDAVAWLAFAEGDLVRAITALGAADATRQRVGVARWALLDALLVSAGVAAESDRPELVAARAAGAEMDPRDAVALTLATHRELAGV